METEIREKLGEEGGENTIRIYYVRRKSNFNKRKMFFMQH